MSTDILNKIINEKKFEVATAALLKPLGALKDECLHAKSKLPFADNLRKANFPAMIAEIKKASPSKGILRADLDPLLAAKSYIENGATCLSVLTDEKFFQGKLEYLSLIKEEFPDTPLLRKDFIIQAYQVWEAKAYGADCILLIVAALSKIDFQFLLEETIIAKLDVLIEVHTTGELDIAIEVVNKVFKNKQDITLPLLGINNRNLHNFETNLTATKDIISYGNRYQDSLCNLDNLLVVTESGIKNGTDIRELRSYGAKAFLVGESLLVSGDLGENLKNLINESKK